MLLSELRFGSFLAFSPKGEAELHRASRRLRTAIKNDSTYRERSAIELAIERLVEVRPAELEEFFGLDVCLVPAPRSAPFPPRDLRIPLQGARDADFLWVPRRICQTLVVAGLAGSWRPLLRRDFRVTQSATAAPEDRPSPLEHFQSLSCSQELVSATRLVVVDDVVTRGATLLACGSRLKEAYPQTVISNFALLRTISNFAELVQIRAPVAGRISLRPQGDTLRRP